MKILISSKNAEQIKHLKEVIKEVFGTEVEDILIEKSYPNAISLLLKYKPSLFIFSYENGKEDIEGKVGLPGTSFSFIGFGKTMKSASTIKKAGGIDFFTLPLDKEVIGLSLEKWKKRNLVPKNITVEAMGGQEVSVLVTKVLYLEADNKHCHIYLKDSKKITAVSTLKDLIAKLPSDFIRVHKTYLVRESIIDRFYYEFGGRYMVALKSGAEIPVGRKFYKSVKISLMKK